MLAASILYITFLLVVTSFAILWSNWPERRGGWLLVTKQKLPTVLKLWHPTHPFVFYFLCAALFLLFAYLEYKAVRTLSSP